MSVRSVANYFIISRLICWKKFPLGACAPLMHDGRVRTKRAVKTILSVFLFVSNSTYAEPAPEQLRHDFETLRPLIDDAAVYPIALTDVELARVARPDTVVRRWEKLEGADRVIGLIWTEVPRDQLWVAIQDDDNWDGVVEGLTEQVLPGSNSGRKFLYQRIDLPWPFSDRQWLIEIVNNSALFDASRSRLMERTWMPNGRRDCELIRDNAVWVDVNDGGWLLAEAAGGTLMIYNARTVVGGAVPDGIATRYAYYTLDKLLRQMVERGRAAADHYNEHHQTLYRPDGSAIEAFE
jgi:hypothetical protein